MATFYGFLATTGTLGGVVTITTTQPGIPAVAIASNSATSDFSTDGVGVVGEVILTFNNANDTVTVTVIGETA